VVVAQLLLDAEDDLLGFARSRASTGASCARRTRSSAETARSAAAPTSSASFPNDASLIRLASMLLIEQRVEWLVSRRQDSLAAVLDAAEDTDKEIKDARGDRLICFRPDKRGR
jgi:hypothetical protein